MAITASPKSFWKTIKGVSVVEIAREANRPLSIAIVGAPDRRADAIAALYAADVPNATGSDAIATRALPESPFIQGYDSTSPDAGFPRQPGLYDLVIDMGGGRIDPPEGALVYSLPELGGWQSALERILDDNPTLALALARNFPVFRRRVSQRIIAQTAAANAQFSLITGAVEQLPLLGQIGLPGAGLSDIIILTKNQSMMVLRLAAAHGLPVDYKSRFKELAPILGNAFGWRAIARELVGFIPVVGFIPKAMIAYAGTMTVGKAAQLYYETGEQITSAQARRLYKEAYELSRDKVKALADKLRPGKNRPMSAPAAPDHVLPAPDVMEAEFTPLEPAPQHERPEEAVAASTLPQG